MTRKITFIIILLLLIVGCFLIIFGTQDFITDHFTTKDELKDTSESLKNDYAKLEKSVSFDIPNKKKKLQSAIDEYETTKSEYDSLIAQTALLNATNMLDKEAGKDIYDVGFLWTIVGNYATEEGVNLRLDISKNTTSPLSYNNNTSDEYVVTDFKFTVTGAYINITDFIYDIEDDDRLCLEINDFQMRQNDVQTEKEPLKAEFTVYTIKLQKSTLIESYLVNPETQSNEEQNGNTSTSSSTTNTTSTSNTTNTSVSSSSSNNVNTIN